MLLALVCELSCSDRAPHIEAITFPMCASPGRALSHLLQFPRSCPHAYCQSCAVIVLSSQSGFAIIATAFEDFCIVADVTTGSRSCSLRCFWLPPVSSWAGQCWVSPTAIRARFILLARPFAVTSAALHKNVLPPVRSTSTYYYYCPLEGIRVGAITQQPMIMTPQKRAMRSHNHHCCANRVGGSVYA